jgi:hypothetical protein
MDADALAVIATELKRIAQAIAPQTLGFGQGPKQVRHIYCNHKQGGVWYFLDEHMKPVNIEHAALTGYVRCLEFKAAIDQGEKAFNLNCTLEAEHFYVLESESTAQFSKGLLSVIAQLTPQELQQALTIVPQVTICDAEVLTCEVYQGNKLVYAPHDEMTNWKEVSKTAIHAVKLANEDELPPVLNA